MIYPFHKTGPSIASPLSSLCQKQGQVDGSMLGRGGKTTTTTRNKCCSNLVLFSISINDHGLFTSIHG